MPYFLCSATGSKHSGHRPAAVCMTEDQGMLLIGLYGHSREVLLFLTHWAWQNHQEKPGSSKICAWESMKSEFFRCTSLSSLPRKRKWATISLSSSPWWAEQQAKSKHACSPGSDMYQGGRGASLPDIKACLRAGSEAWGSGHTSSSPRR